MTPEQIKKFITVVESSKDGTIIVKRRPRADRPFKDIMENIRSLNFEDYDYDLLDQYRPYVDTDETYDLIGREVIKKNDPYKSIIVGTYDLDTPGKKEGFEIKNCQNGIIEKVPFSFAFEKYSFNRNDLPIGVKIEGTSIY